MSSVLQFHNVSFSYPGDGKSVLEELDLAIQKGEFVSLVGPSGSGKSTILRLVTGLEEVQHGKVMVHGKSIEPRDGAVGYMPQQDLLLPWRTIEENAALPLECRGMKRKDAYAKVREYLPVFGLDGYERKHPKDLSGGMRQRVSFLRTFLTGADVLLLDEPFSALDAITKLNMQEWLYEQWRKWGKTIVFITHDVEEALFLSNRVLIVTEQPICSLTELTVPLGKERTRRDLARPELLELREELISMLKGKVPV